MMFIIIIIIIMKKEPTRDEGLATVLPILIKV